MKVAIYIRVSTRDKQDITKQKDFLVDFVNKQDNWEIYNIYADQGVSGSKQHRPSLDELLKNISDWDLVLVYKLDRIGRSMKHLFELMELFEKKGKKFASATQNIDTSKPEGRLFFNLLASFAEFEREMIVMRVNDGLATAKSRGVKLGRKVGSKDHKPRRKVGYHMRWENERKKELAFVEPKNEIERQMRTND